ncbi:MAG: hypothetical protein KGH55_01440 [Nanoarchaeota archaeon]|nr:hypothetical protein [Nanoarchaeota archaeon]
MFKEFLKELNGRRVEGEMLKTAVVSLLTSAIFLIGIYFLSLKNISEFIPKYGLDLFFISLSYALIILVVRQIRAYKEFACMSGMMIGMTLGMISSFLIGFYVASINGMFFGGFFGIAVGFLFGIWNGKCCGIMGIMEGMMAAFMGGLMGAMTAFMLINDHLKIAFILVFIISAIIMVGLNYMVYKETKEREREIKEGYFSVIVLTFVLMAITTWFIVFGPRGGIFA